MKKTLEKAVKIVLLYIGIPAVIGAALCGADFIPLPDPQTRAIAGAVVFGIAGFVIGLRKNFA